MEVAVAQEYNHAYEIVRLANAAYRILNELSLKRPADSGQPRNLGLSETKGNQ